MQRVARGKSQGLSLGLELDFHFEDAAQKANRFILHHVILIAQRLAPIDMENFPDIAVGVSPNELVTPRLID
jgi:hypothetical protein